MKILVVGGGYSSERSISLLSSKAVFDALVAGGYDTNYLDWSGDEQQLQNACKAIDIVVPIVHGVGGEDGKIQQILEEIGVQFAGTGSAQSRLCIDKQATKDELAKHSIVTPRGEVTNYDAYLKSELRTKPHVVKPIDEGSSVDTFIVHDNSDPNLDKKIKESFNKNKQMLVEEYVAGIEITVAVLDGKSLPVTEIVPPAGQWFDYANKYNGATVESCPPVHVTDQLQAEATKLAQQVHEILGARHFSRVDMIIKDDKLYVLELNTIPGMTNQSLFPKAALAGGLNMVDLMSYIIELVSKDSGSN